MSKLVICEKPSVAQSIGKVLGASKRCDGYLEGGGYIVSWCVGHLVELAQPEAYGETYAKWRLEDPALYAVLKMAFDNLHCSPFWSITPDFIMELGEAYLSLLSHKFLRERLS